MKQTQISKPKFAVLTLFAFLAISVTALARQQSNIRINLNTASIQEMQTLPGIGPKLAARIFEYRQRHGSFKRPQDVIIVRGMSANKFRQIASLVIT